MRLQEKGMEIARGNSRRSCDMVMLSSENIIPIPFFVKWVYSYLIQSIFWLWKKASHFQWPANPPPTFHLLSGLLILFMFPKSFKVKKKVIQVLRGKIYWFISYQHVMIWSHLLIQLTFSYIQRGIFFPFKNTFFLAGRNTFETNISILSGN